MKRDISYIIKRIIIGVGIALVLGFLSGLTGFIVPVYAETGSSGTSSSISKPEPILGVDSNSGSSSTFTNMHGLSSNAFVEGAYEYPRFGLFQYGIRSSLCNNESGLCPVSNSPTAQYYDDQLHNGDFELKKSDSETVYVYGSNVYFDFDESVKISNGSHYTLLLEFTKSEGITYFNRTPDLTLSTLNATNDPQHLVDIDITSYTSNVGIKWVRFKNGNSSSNWAFLQLDFDIDNVPLSSIYLRDLYITFNDGENPTNVQPIPLPNIMFSNGSSDYEYSVDAYFVENGSVQFDGWNCTWTDITNECFRSDNYFDPDYDYVYASDIRVFEDIPQCSDTDIICHIKQVFAMIKSFFVRMSNFFREMLYPNNNFTIAQQYFDTFHLEDGGLASVITAPLGVIQSLDANSCSPVNITLPQVNEQISFPCLKSSVYQVYFPNILLIIQAITTGYICYTCLSSIFKTIRSLQNPDTNDKIEVVKL